LLLSHVLLLLLLPPDPWTTGYSDAAAQGL